MKLDEPNAGGPPTERDRPLASFGLTNRQARFLVTVMRHSGVFVGRQYAAFAGITHGQKVHDFILTLLVRRLANSMELGTTGRTRIIHVHYKPLYAAIGDAVASNPLNRQLADLMLRSLLGERFKLAAHPEKREMPVLALRLAHRDGTLGPTLKHADVDCAALKTVGTRRDRPHEYCDAAGF